MDKPTLLDRIKSRFPQVQEAVPVDPKYVRPDDLQVKVPAARVAELAAFARDDLGFDLLNFVTAVDWIKEDRFEVVYHFTRTAEPTARFFVKVDLPRAGEPSLPSLARIYPAADWQERETYDLFGIRFDGHPNLKRILLWEGYPGWPLRKDYVHTPDRYDNGFEIGLPKAAAAHDAEPRPAPAAPAPKTAPKSPPEAGTSR